MRNLSVTSSQSECTLKSIPDTYLMKEVNSLGLLQKDRARIVYTHSQRSETGPVRMWFSAILAELSIGDVRAGLETQSSEVAKTN